MAANRSPRRSSCRRRGTTAPATAARVPPCVADPTAVSMSRGSTPVQLLMAAVGNAFIQGLDIAPNGRADVGYQALHAIDPTTFGTGNAAIDSWFVSKPPNGGWSAPLRVTTVASDPAASAQNNL